VVVYADAPSPGIGVLALDPIADARHTMLAAIAFVESDGTADTHLRLVLHLREAPALKRQ
jgi:hypothetical protein